MFCFGIYDSDGTTVDAFIKWSVAAQLLDAVSGGSTVADGGSVASWQSDNGVYALVQATAGQRPLRADTAFPGRNGVVFSADDNLAVTLPAFQGAILLVIGPQSGTRTVLAVDTVQATTEAGLSISVEESFG